MDLWDRAYPYVDEPEVAQIQSGPLFRAKRSRHNRQLSTNRMDVRTMYRVLMGYLRQLPGAMKVEELENKTIVEWCLYTTHTLRATNATLLLDAGVDIRDVQKLLGHKAITVTEIYDKRRTGAKGSASHKLVL